MSASADLRILLAEADGNPTGAYEIDMVYDWLFDRRHRLADLIDAAENVNISPRDHIERGSSAGWQPDSCKCIEYLDRLHAALSALEGTTESTEGELCSCGNRVAHLNRDTGKCWSCS